MKTRWIFLAMAVGVCSASAQVRKCEKDGKVVYSDAICADATAKETMVDTSANSIDHSGLRDQAAKNTRAAQVQAAARPARSAEKPPSRFAECDAMQSAKPMPTAAEAGARKACMLKAAKR